MATSHAAAQGVQDLVLELAAVQKTLESQSQASLQLARQVAALGASAEQLSETATMSVDVFEQSTHLPTKTRAQNPKEEIVSTKRDDEATEHDVRNVNQDPLIRRPWIPEGRRTANLGVEGSFSSHSRMVPRSGLFQDTQELQTMIRDSLRGNQYSVTNYYKETGVFQAIAKSSAFEQLSLLLVMGSSLWIAVDLDLNQAVMLHRADIGFQAAANATCILFLAELMVRFLAFKTKRHILKDFWCMFDLLVMFFLVVETWVLWCVIAAFDVKVSDNNMRVLIVFRMMRLVRLLRLVKLFRFLPELLLIVRGILIAMRAISLVFVLLFVIIYMGGIACRVLLENTSVGKERFETVSQAMGTLLLDCALSGTRGAMLMREAYEVHPIYSFVMFCFALIANVTIMGVLGALLVQTIKRVAEMEEEERQVVKNWAIMDNFWTQVATTDENNDGYIAHDEFLSLLSKPDTLKLLKDLDVNPEIVMFLSDFMFEENNGRLSKDHFIQWVLDLRGTQRSTVKDHYVTRKFVKAKLNQILEAVPKAKSNIQTVPSLRRC